MAGGEGAPAVVENVVVGVCAGGVRYQFVFGCSWGWVAARKQVGAWSAYRVFDDLYYGQICIDIGKNEISKLTSVTNKVTNRLIPKPSNVT